MQLDIKGAHGSVLASFREVGKLGSWTLVMHRDHDDDAKIVYKLSGTIREFVSTYAAHRPLKVRFPVRDKEWEWETSEIAIDERSIVAFLTGWPPPTIR